MFLYVVSTALQPLQEVIVAQWLFCLKPVKNQQIHHKMAQGSFASRIFHKYCKNSQEHREPDSEVPHISEFTTMWEKLSKCSVLPLHIKYVGHPLQLQTEVFGCIRMYGTEKESAFVVFEGLI